MNINQFTITIKVTLSKICSRVYFLEWLEEIVVARYLLAKRRRAKEKDQSIVRQAGAVHKADARVGSGQAVPLANASQLGLLVPVATTDHHLLHGAQIQVTLLQRDGGAVGLLLGAVFGQQAGRNRVLRIGS